MQSQTEEEKEKLYPETACIIRLCKLLFFGGVPKKIYHYGEIAMLSQPGSVRSDSLFISLLKKVQNNSLPLYFQCSSH